jgi:hypothetical protein
MKSDFHIEAASTMTQPARLGTATMPQALAINRGAKEPQILLLTSHSMMHVGIIIGSK